MLPFGIADSLFSTVDYKTVARLFTIYGKRVVNELAQGNVPLFGDTAKKLLRSGPRS
jgi:hypothetical protein